MSKNVFEKIISKHIVTGTARAGCSVGIKIDQTLTQDATGTMAYLAFEQLGIPKTKTEVSVSYVDHNTLQQSFENADDHKYLETIARKYGLRYSKAGNLFLYCSLKMDWLARHHQDQLYILHYLE